jgi:hypothetical protein
MSPALGTPSYAERVQLAMDRTEYLLMALMAAILVAGAYIAWFM